MIRTTLLALVMCWAGLAHADTGSSEPWLAEPEDVALLRDCLARTPVALSGACRFRIASPCLELADTVGPSDRVEAMAACHDREAAAWGVVMNADAWPRAVSAAATRDEVEDRENQFYPLMEERLRASQTAWNEYWRRQCAYAYADGVLSGLPRVEASACISQMLAERVIFLIGVWNGE